jgi:hypothetical protein
MTKKYFLGLDISTSIIGVSLFENSSLKELFYIDLTKTKCIFNKSKQYKDFINNKLSGITIDKIYIEDTLQSFSRGLSSAKTLMTLARFNGIVSNITFEVTGIKPEFINVNVARKTLGIKINKEIDKDKKEQVMDWVDLDLGGYDWPTKIISRGKNKGLVKYEKFCYDIADAYVICKAGIIINEQNIK